MKKFTESKDILVQESALNGCYFIKAKSFQDQRGSFVKLLSSDTSTSFHPGFEIKEVFFSESNKDVIRGMHFQNPPHDHSKLVSCLRGQILDVVLDIRKSSSTYGQAVSFKLSAMDGCSVLIPKGFAHGFLALEDHSIVSYMVETARSAECESGILWNSFGFDWPVTNPILSVRDQEFLSLKDFKTQF